MIDLASKNVLVIAPHADDETLGASFVLQRAKRAFVVVAAVGSYTQPDGLRSDEKLRRAELGGALAIQGAIDHEVLSNLEGRLEEFGMMRLVSALEKVVRRERPDAVFVNLPSHHQDHRTLFDATLAALRNTFHAAVFAYEYPSRYLYPSKVEGGRFYVTGTEQQHRQKMAALSVYRSQFRSGRRPTIDDSARLAMSRGVEARSYSAELFHLLRAQT